MGGNNGKQLRKVLIDENINFSSISCKGETRAAYPKQLKKSKNKITSIFEPTAPLSISEINEFKTKLIKMIQNSKIVIFSGSVPNKEAAAIITYGIELANQLDKTTILDNLRKSSSRCINAKPTVLHNNVHENLIIRRYSN